MPFVTVTYPPKFPLTEAERSWLEGRKSMCLRCDCYIDHLVGAASCWDGMRKGWAVPDCKMFYRADLVPDYKDVAEFEAKCASLWGYGIFRRWREVFPENRDVCKVCREMRLATSAVPGYCRRSDTECKRMWCRILTEMEMEA